MELHLTMTGRLTDCVLLSYRTPAASVAHLLPEGLELVTRGPWAFWNLVACRVEAMRPKVAGVAAPVMMGVTYHHVAYRLLVQAMTHRADVRRGLYFLRSDADARLLGTFGNWSTDFKFHHAQIDLRARPVVRDDDAAAARVDGLPGYDLKVVTADSRADARLVLGHEPARLAADSCFATLRDAQEFLKYEPFALAVHGGSGRRQVRLAEVQRDEAAWREHAVAVGEHRFDYLAHLGQDELGLELASRVEPMDYLWKLGRTEPLLGQSRGEREQVRESPTVRSA